MTIQNSAAPAATQTAGAPAVVERLPRQRETIVVESAIPVLDTAMFEHMQRIATMMASSSLVPVHLNSVRRVGGQDVAIEPKEAIANCFLVVNQSIRWKMDPFAVAQHTYTNKGKLGYEGKLVAAVINSHPMIEKRLSYIYDGPPHTKDRKVTVTAKIKGEDQPRYIDGSVKQWETTGTGSPWSYPDDYDQMLSYRGAREWARRHFPEVMLGVLGDDELQQFEATERTLAPEQHAPAQQRGAAALKAALNAGTATDAEVVGETKKDEPTQAVTSANAAPQVGPVKAAGTEQSESRSGRPADAASAKPAGTIEQRDAFIKKFGECKDTEILALVRDEARMYAWTAADQEVLDVAYSKRQDDLERG